MDYFDQIRKTVLSITEYQNVSGNYFELYAKGVEIGNQKFDIEEDFILNTINPMKFNWYSEKPPLGWYILAIAIFCHSENFPLKSRLELIKASNYYGDSKLALNLSDVDYSNIIFKYKYELLKQRAKAYKNKGDFEQAINTYRILINSAINEDKTIYIPHLLVLFAKLHDEYKQRKGWHYSFLKVAYNRFEKIRRTNNKQLLLWNHICKISYFKSASFIDSNEKVKRPRILKWENINSRIRAKLTFLLVDINNELKKEYSIESYLFIKNKIEQFHETLNKLIEIENIRAFYIRNVQFFYLKRLFIQWIKDVEKKSENINNTDISILNICIENSQKIADWKTTATAIHEKVLWGKNIFKKNNYFSDLVDSKKIIENNNESLLANLYHDIIIEIADYYKIQKDWQKAVQFYEESFQYSNRMLQSLRQDEKIINEIINESKFPNEDDFVEFKFLTKNELFLIRDGIILDYKVLTDRLIKISDNIFSLQSILIMENNIQNLPLIIKRLKHIVRGKVNYIKDKVKEFEQDQNKISVLYRLLGSIVSEIDYNFDTENIKNTEDLELIEIIKHFVKTKNVANYYGNDLKLGFKSEEKNIYFKTNRQIIFELLDNVIYNIVEGAENFGIQNITIMIYLYVENNTIYIKISDNIGDYHRFQLIIQDLNKGEKIISTKGIGRGYALEAMKESINIINNIKIDWKLNLLDNKIKELIIPFGKRL